MKPRLQRSRFGFIVFRVMKIVYQVRLQLEKNESLMMPYSERVFMSAGHVAVFFNFYDFVVNVG